MLKGPNNSLKLLAEGWPRKGSLIGMVAGQRASADAYVSVAGAGRPVKEILLEQVKSQYHPIYRNQLKISSVSLLPARG